MAYYIGIDGGGTKTKCVISTENGVVLAEGVSGRSNPNANYGIEKSVENIILSINKSLEQLRKKENMDNFSRINIKRIVMGISGAGPKNRIKMKTFFEEKYIQNLLINYDELYIYGDTHTCWYGAFEGEPGILSITGTGHFVYGRNKNLVATSGDEEHKSFIDKQKIKEAGYHIGLYGLKIALTNNIYAMKKNNEKDLLYSLIENAYNEGSLWNDFKNLGNISFENLLIHINSILDGRSEYVVKDEELFSADKIAQIAQFVSFSADKGHTPSINLLKKAATIFVTNVDFVRMKLNFKPDEIVNVCFVGSVIKSTVFKKYVIHELNKIKLEKYGINFVYPKHKPEIGALLMAIRGIIL
jgi:N-acetylglucosamine kinase-like BadF-type ATPase